MISEYKMAEGGSPTLPPNPPGPILHPDIIPDIIPVDLGWITGIFFNLAFFNFLKFFFIYFFPN